MGYRSEIAFRMSRSNYDAMMASLELLKKGQTDEFTKTLQHSISLEEIAEDVEDILGDELISKGDKFVDFQLHSIKWSDYYPSVQFIKHFMEINDEYDFLEIGEEIDDVITEYHTGTYPFGISRDVAWN